MNDLTKTVGMDQAAPATVEELVEILEATQWDGGIVCVVCGGKQRDGHRDDCRLARTLRVLRGEARRFVERGYGATTPAVERPLVSSIRLEEGPHDRVTVFNRGANAGTLTVRAGDGIVLARRLLPSGEER